MLYLYQTAAQLNKRKKFLQQKIDKCADFFLIFGYSREIEEIDGILALHVKRVELTTKMQSLLKFLKT